MRYDFFLSHYQATGGDQVMTLELRLSHMGFVCWLDQKVSIFLLRNNTLWKRSLVNGNPPVRDMTKKE